MLGRVYTFERLWKSDFRPSVEPVSLAALRAVTLAMAGERGIRFEELTEFENTRPMIVVLFNERDAIARFDRNLRHWLPREIDVSVMGTLLGRAEASDPHLDTAARGRSAPYGRMQSPIGRGLAR